MLSGDLDMTSTRMSTTGIMSPSTKKMMITKMKITNQSKSRRLPTSAMATGGPKHRTVSIMTTRTLMITRTAMGSNMARTS